MAETQEQTFPYWDPKMCSMVVKKTEDWIVSVTPMLFNDRICLTSHSDYPYGYTAGWCYDKGPGVVLAAAIWDPETDREPAGYKKLACDSRPR